MDVKQIELEARAAMRELLDRADLKPGSLVVVGCSSSEIAGGVIGHDSALELAEAAFQGLYAEIEARGLFLAAQCCITPAT